MNGEKHLLPVSMADAVVYADYPVSPLAKDEVDEISQKISDIVMEEVPDGATIQLGLGKISTAIGYGLLDKNDLGIFSELFSVLMLDLM